VTVHHRRHPRGARQRARQKQATSMSTAPSLLHAAWHLRRTGTKPLNRL
jgi:hypothetical protein